MIRIRALCALGGPLVSIAAVLAQTNAPASLAKSQFTAKKWAALNNASPVAVASNAILYRVSYGAEKGPTTTDFYTVDADGSHALKLALPEHFTPMGFMRDGLSLFGTWEVDHHRQLAIFALKDGRAAAAPSTVVFLPRGIGSVSPSPDGNRFAITADPRPPDPRDEIRHIQEPEQTSLYVVNADGTHGTWWCADVKSIVEAPLWAADAGSVALLSQLPRIGHHDVATDIDVCSAGGSRHVATIQNYASDLAWADGGQTLAFLSTASAVLTPEHVYSVPVSGGTGVDRTPLLDGTVTQMTGDASGHVWASVEHGVRNEVDEFSGNALKTATIWPDGIVRLPVTTPYSGVSAPAAFAVSDPTHLANVAVADGGHLRKITSEGDAQLANIDLGPVRVVRWKSKEGIALEGIATFPAGYVEGRKYPFLVLPHGGPEGNDALAFDPISRIIAGLGYVVLQPEYRGSTGYGADFMAAIYQHFGDRAYRDVDSATDFAIAQGWADPSRLAIFGWSAGGFMTAWTVTQTSRYKAAIEGAGITDWAPFLWTSDVQQIDYDARWTDTDPEAFRQFSAVAFADKVTTPLLILHGESDLRVPTFQGMEYFQLLAARGKTVRMVTYPGSGHFPNLWEQRIDIFDQISDWLERYDP